MVDWSKAPEGAEYYGRAADWNFDTYFMFIGESLYWFKGEQWALFSSDKSYERSVQQVSHMQKRPDTTQTPDWGKCKPNIATHYGTILNMTGFWHINGNDVRFSDDGNGWVDLKFQGDRTKLLEGLTPRPEGIAQYINNAPYVGTLDGGRPTLPTDFLAKAIAESNIKAAESIRKQLSANSISSAQDFLSEGVRILGDRGKQYGSNERECSFPQVAQAFNAITGHELKASDVCLILALIKQVRQYAQPERFHEDSAVDGVNYTALQAQELKKERENG